MGALVVRGEASFEALLRGGPQERRRRGGTENVPGIVGLGAAAALAARELAERGARVRARCAIGSGTGSRRRSRACGATAPGRRCCATR